MKPDFENSIQRLLWEARMTQKELAEYAGTSRMTIHELVHGKRQNTHWYKIVELALEQKPE